MAKVLVFLFIIFATTASFAAEEITLTTIMPRQGSHWTLDEATNSLYTDDTNEDGVNWNVGIGVIPKVTLDVNGHLALRDADSDPDTGGGVYMEAPVIGMQSIKLDRDPSEPGIWQFRFSQGIEVRGFSEFFPLDPTSPPPYLLKVGGNLRVNGNIKYTGDLIKADYVFMPDYKLESIGEHAKLMWKEKRLPAMPVLQKTKDGKYEIDIGTYQNGMLEELEKAHIYIAQLKEALDKQEERIARLENARQ